MNGRLFLRACLHLIPSGMMLFAGLQLTANISSGYETPPRNREQLKSRMAVLRNVYSPYLRSLPKKIETRAQQPIGPAWRTKFEVEEATDYTVPKAPKWYGKDFDDSNWPQVDLPEWRYSGSNFRRCKNCILWYRTKFSAAQPKSGKRIFLIFEGVDWEAQVWLNGKPLGTHRTYYEPFRFDVTSLLEEENALAVRVIEGPRYGEPVAYWTQFPVVPAEQKRYVPDRSKSVVGNQKGDFHIGSGFGIHGDVYLETTSDPCISTVFARGNPIRGEARIKVETDAAEAEPKNVTLSVEIIPENFSGDSYSTEKNVSLPKGAGVETLSIKMPQAKVWSPQTPYLYRCRAVLKQKGKIIDAQDVLFGNRSFAMVSEKNPHKGLQPGTLLLNGEPVFLRGTNINGFNALSFWGQRDKLIDVLLMLKAANFNCVRSCQHVCFPEVRELMDRLGIMSEQDQGGGRKEVRKDILKQLEYCGKSLARVCYNNPGVVLLSFANESHFEPAKIVQEALKADPERIITPISGDPYGGNAYPREGRTSYSLTDDQWANVVCNFHAYRGWYAFAGQVWKLSQRLKPGRMVIVGEYGAEAIDGYDTMAKNYPSHFGQTPPPETDKLFGHIQVKKVDRKQIAGLRGRVPKNLGQYIEASQTYQADVVAEVTKAWRLSSDRICGYFHFHFIDILPANWPKSIISHDLCPKKSYYTIAQLNQPVVLLPEIVDHGNSMEIWAANDFNKPFENCRVNWSINSNGKTLAGGELKANIPATNAQKISQVDLDKITQKINVVTVLLELKASDGQLISRYEQEIFLRAWCEEDKIWPKFPKPNLDKLSLVDPARVKMRTVTKGPKFHWFGYYDKDQIDASGRYLLAMEVDFEHRSPKADDIIKIGMVDLQDNDRWIELAETRAWSWQQGCMLQWRPGSKTEILFNDRDGDHFVCRIYDVKTRKMRTLPMPIEHVSPDGKLAVCSDYRRIQYIRSGYGYAGLSDPNLNVNAPDDVGAWLMDMETGETKLLVTIAQLAKIPYPKSTPNDKHYLSHFQWSTDGKRFNMFNRWVGGEGKQPTRVFTAAADGSDVRLLSEWGASHWVWRDSKNLLIWAFDGYKIYKDDGSGKPKNTLWYSPNGHQSYIPGTDHKWLVADTYPRGRNREQTLYLFHLPTSRAVVLGRFHLPKEYRGEWRCDLHPRTSRDGKYVVIDSPHGGNGRQQYLFDISAIVGTGS